MASQNELRSQIRALRRQLAPPGAPTTPAQQVSPVITRATVQQQAFTTTGRPSQPPPAPPAQVGEAARDEKAERLRTEECAERSTAELEGAGAQTRMGLTGAGETSKDEVMRDSQVTAPAPIKDHAGTAVGQPAGGGESNEKEAGGGGGSDSGGNGDGVGGRAGTGASQGTAVDNSALLAELEELLNKRNAAARMATADYLRNVGSKALWASLVLIVAFDILLTIVSGPLPKTDCGTGVRCAQFHQAVWAAAATWVAVALVSWLKQSEGGMIVMLIGRDGRFSTSYFQAWVWTVVLCWGFAFFLVDEVVRKAADVGAVANHLDADYFLLLGGPYAALVVAQQVKSSKLSSGEVQEVQSSSTTVKDLFSSDDGRTDLVDTQYLFFNFVALATFAVMFARTPTDFPNLPDGLVLLTSGAALAYIGNKAVEKNKPGITTIALESGAGTPRVGDLVRVNGFNFIPAGAEFEEYLARVRVRFGPGEAPVTPPATAPTAGADSAAAPVGADERSVPTLYADNVTSSALRVAIPQIPALPEDGGVVEVVVVTSGGAQTDPYPLFVQPRRLHVVLPAMASAGQPFELHLPDVPAGEFVRVNVGGKFQDAQVDQNHRFIAAVPPGLTGSTTVVVTGFGGTATNELTLR